MVEQAVDVTMTSEVDDDRVGRRHEQDHSAVLQTHAAPGPRRADNRYLLPAWRSTANPPHRTTLLWSNDGTD